MDLFDIFNADADVNGTESSFGITRGPVSWAATDENQNVGQAEQTIPVSGEAQLLFGFYVRVLCPDNAFYHALQARLFYQIHATQPTANGQSHPPPLYIQVCLQQQHIPIPKQRPKLDHSLHLHLRGHSYE
ncbi:hypothetical protein SMACR_07697 [Sordaria macrospora]|uniref:WGS project CABT00000000 data, contig 2.27 n=2 Tax=Sordaria macrospora TaxID=5147 RepID=F7W4F3_SORMK|nr:uncharacterized protein SMAC_07697 [Sordaria macrospora k-hell]KAA8634884.1 hypothetical protein SMACR_07697 [Sordaria macrospora]WPJ67405.1 hypothetical protein SMAC4_07697 [Sordaria macrospora]CCC14906.1 unnamed protein product [Sordaria macrospora k-hell]